MRKCRRKITSARSSYLSQGKRNRAVQSYGEKGIQVKGSLAIFRKPRSILLLVLRKVSVGKMDAKGR